MTNPSSDANGRGRLFARRSTGVRLAMIVAAFAVCEVLIGWIIAVVLIGRSGSGMVQPFDTRVAASLALATGTSGHQFAAVVTWLGSWLILIPLATLVIVLAVRRRSWQPVLLTSVAVIGAEIVSQLVKRLVARPRPPGTTEFGYAFPSGHATMAGVTALIVVFVISHRSPGARRIISVIAVSVTLLVAWSRLALGAHWSTDVLAGFAVGWSWALFAVWLVGVNQTPAMADGIAA